MRPRIALKGNNKTYRLISLNRYLIYLYEKNEANIEKTRTINNVRVWDKPLFFSSKIRNIEINKIEKKKAVIR